eukprot:44638_1
MKLFTTLVIAAISIVPAPAISAFTSTSLVHHHALTTSVKLDMSTRRDVIVQIASGLAIIGSAAKPALAESVVIAPSSSQVEDNEIVKEQRTVVGKLDINNAAVADYMEFPGMYPKIGGKIANNGPYKSVKDIYNIKGLSSAEIGTIKKYESKLTATPATGLDTLRGRDPYRRSFNK